MRVTSLHRHGTPDPVPLPDAGAVYEMALERLESSHEHDAASCLAACRLELVAAGGNYPLREELRPVRLVLFGPDPTMSLLEQCPEIRGRVRQALDGALGSTVYLTQMALLANAGTLAA